MHLMSQCHSLFSQTYMYIFLVIYIYIHSSWFLRLAPWFLRILRLFPYISFLNYALIHMEMQMSL